MGILDIFGKKHVDPRASFSLKAETHPYSLPAGANDFVDLELGITSNSDAPLLTSLVIEVPKGLGFERSAISQVREIRLGFVKPGEGKFVKVQLWGTQRTGRGSYPVRVHALSHYNDYAHVLNDVRKTVEFRVT